MRARIAKTDVVIASKIEILIDAEGVRPGAEIFLLLLVRKDLKGYFGRDSEVYSTVGRRG